MLPQQDNYETVRDCRMLFVRRLGDLLRNCGALSDGAITAIQQGAGAYFDDVVATRQRSSFEEEVDGLTSSRITLVGHEDLELDIRLDNLGARLAEATGARLWEAYLRFVTLLRRPDLAKSDNPIGPRGIRQGLNDMFAAAGAASLDNKLDLLDKIETHLLGELPVLYGEINEFLARAGVEPAQPAIVSAPDTPHRTEPEAAPALSGNLLLALQQSLLAQAPTGAGQLPPGSAGMPASGGSVASLLNQAVMERILARLNELDLHAKPLANFQPERSNSLESLIPGLFQPAAEPQQLVRPPLNSGELGIPAHAPEAVAIDTLAMIFEALFADPELPDALKAIISSLQIALLKVAMQDVTFFTEPAHPVRHFLDRLRIAMLGLPIDVSSRHPICERLFAIATDLRSKFSGDIAVFDTARQQVDELIDERQSRIARLTEAYLPLLHQMDKHDKAILQTSRSLDRLITPGQPLEISSFLDQKWRAVLQTVWLEHGPDSDEWRTHLHFVNELLWSLEPKPGAEGRAALAKRLPEMLKTLKRGMDRVGMTQEEQAGFLDTCFALQTKAMRASATAEAPLVSTQTSLPEISLKKPGAQAWGELKAGDLHLHTLDFASYQPAPIRPLPCKEGDWLDIRTAEGRNVTANLCRLSVISQRALLCNPDSGLALSIHPSILERQLAQGEARICDTGSLFEKAAAAALGQTTGQTG